MTSGTPALEGLPTEEELRAAAEGLRAVLAPTPLLAFRPPGAGGDAADLWLKPEVLQPSGSFKLRGVHHAVARLDPRRRGHGLETVSAGNTALALAWCGRHFGVPARAIVPEHAPRVKTEAVHALGGETLPLPMPEVFRYLEERRWEEGERAFVHPWTDRDLWVGHGTLGLELVLELPDLDTVFVPVGGGGLLAGVGSALRALAPGVRVVAVEPAGCPAFHAARRAGHPVRVECRTSCDGVAVPFVTEELFGLLDALADDVVLVEEEEVAATLRDLALGNKLVVEPSGALATAAARRLAPPERGRSVALVTGGGIDAATLAGLLGA